MRDEMISIMQASEHNANDTKSNRKSGLKTTSRMHAKSPTSSILVSIQNGLDQKSELSSEAGAAT